MCLSAGQGAISNDGRWRLLCTSKAPVAEGTTKSTGARKGIKRYGKRYPFNRNPADLCARFENSSEPDWPANCQAREGRVSVKILRPASLIVRRSTPMQIDVFVQGGQAPAQSVSRRFIRPKPAPAISQILINTQMAKAYRQVARVDFPGVSEIARVQTR